MLSESFGIVTSYMGDSLGAPEKHASGKPGGAL
jgi:hypothetical protein